MQISDRSRTAVRLSYCQNNWWSPCQTFCPKQTLSQCEPALAALAAVEEASRCLGVERHEAMSGNEIFDVEGVT